MKARLFLTLLIIFNVVNPTFALDWKALHEKADGLSLEQALAKAKLSFDSVESLYTLGLVYLNLHQDKKALYVFSEVIKKDTQVFEAEWGVAEALRRQHKINEAENILQGIIRANPDFTPAYISLAYIRYIQMDFEKSVRLSLSVIKMGREKSDLSNYARAYAMYAGAKGMIAHYGGPLSKAVNGLAVKPNLDKAYKLQPNSPGVLFGLGSYYFLAPVIAGGDKNKAEKYLKKTIEVDPLFADAYVRLAQLYKIRGDNDKYNTYMDKGLELDPKNVLALDHKSGSCKFICAGGDESVKP